jgi:translation elongation factor EF-4
MGKVRLPIACSNSQVMSEVADYFTTSQKSLLSYEQTGTINSLDDNKQVLDRLKVERERGITIKAVTASMLYTHDGTEYLLNLIDTPVSTCWSFLIDD